MIRESGDSRDSPWPSMPCIAYIVAIRDQSGTNTGNVDLIIDGPSSTARGHYRHQCLRDRGTTSDSSINPEDTDFYRFTAPAQTDGTLTVTVTPAPRPLSTWPPS